MIAGHTHCHCQGDFDEDGTKLNFFIGLTKTCYSLSVLECG